MNEDSVLRDVRSAREAFARSHGNSIRSMVAELREQDAAGDWTIVKFAPRRPSGTIPIPLDANRTTESATTTGPADVPPIGASGSTFAATE